MRLPKKFCPVCGIAFPSPGTLKRHCLDSHERPLPEIWRVMVREKSRTYRYRYNHSPKGKASRRRYAKGKGRGIQRAAQLKYSKTEKGYAAAKRYYSGDHGKAKRKEWWDAHPDKMREYRRNWARKNRRRRVA